MNRHWWIALTLLFAATIAGCGDATDPAVRGENAAADAVAGQAVDPSPGIAGQTSPTTPTPKGALETVVLDRFECGDNCYLTFTRPGGGEQSGPLLCVAPACADWQAEGRLPPALASRRAEVRFGTADQVDGGGAVMASNVRAVVDLRLVPPPVASEPSAATVPIEPGAYVIEGSDCAAPANAGFRVWNGAGLSGSSTRECRAEVRSRDGDAYRISNSCENTYDGSRTAEGMTITVLAPTRFRNEDGMFRKCPADALPEWLRKAAGD